MTEFLQERLPEIWVADRYGGPLSYGVTRQMGLARLLRDTEHAIEVGDTVFAPGFRRVLPRAVAIGQRRAALKDGTLAPYGTDLDRRLDTLLAGPEPKPDAARRLDGAMRRTMPICSASSPAVMCPAPTQQRQLGFTKLHM